MGRKKRPFYRLVVLDSRKRRDGAYLANLGYYNPFTDPHEINLHPAEIISWLQKGATVSETARSLLRSEGVLYRYSLMRQGLGEGEIDAKVAEWKSQAEAGRLKKVEARAAAEKAKAEAEAQAAREAAEKEAAEKAAAEAAEKEAAEKAAAEAAEKEAAEKAAAEEDAAEEPPAEEPAAEAAAEEAPAEEPAAEAAEAEEEKKDQDS